MRRIVACASAFALVGACPVAAQAPPVRPLGPITHVSAVPLASVASAVEVSGGRVYVNDITDHRLLLLDSTLAKATVVLDSTREGANEYGNAPGTLLSFREDSVLFIAPLSLSMLVLSPDTGIVRVAAIPLTDNPLVLVGSIYGTPAFDAAGRLVYFGRAWFNGATTRLFDTPIEPPDSAFVVRFDLRTRTLDTAASIRIPRARSIYKRDAEGRVTSLIVTAFPPQTVDDWAVTSDGAIAVVRGRDYHVDRLNPDSTWTTGPRLPYKWERIDDAKRDSLIDSAATALETIFDTVLARMRRAGSESGGILVFRPGTEQELASMDFRRPIFVMRAPGASQASSGPEQRDHAERARIDDVPDYRPPFRQGATHADRAGNLWIRTNNFVNEQPVYDVVNRAGQLVDRVLLPPFRVIAGFGPGVVFMAVRDSAGGVHVERALIR